MSEGGKEAARAAEAGAPVRPQDDGRRAPQGANALSAVQRLLAEVDTSLGLEAQGNISRRAVGKKLACRHMRRGRIQCLDCRNQPVP